tara:strand:- start:322 stop:567 length:246 start_codon:yes stop_codon:yes gene_type:complete
MNKYITNGRRSVVAESMSDAAAVFANRAARDKFGRSGYSRTCTLASWSQDNTLGEFSAFIGHTTGRNETTGKNINFTVWRI